MSLHDEIDLLANRMDAFNALWGYYITVGLAAAGVLIAYRNEVKGRWGYTIAGGFTAQISVVCARF